LQVICSNALQVISNSILLHMDRAAPPSSSLSSPTGSRSASLVHGRLEGSAAVVTGSTRGIGFSIAQALVAEGARVVVNGRDVDAVSRAAETLGNGVIGVSADVNSPEGARSLVHAAVDSLGKLDILVNNAGAPQADATIDLSVERFRAVIDQNLTSTFLCSQEAAKIMLGQATGGSIVNVASMVGIVPAPRRAAYAAAKAGVIALTRVFAAEYGPLVRCNAVAPGYVDTDLTKELKRRGAIDSDRIVSRTPMKRFGTPAEVAQAVLFLASPASAYASGSVLLLDGGFTSAAAWS